MVVPSEAQVKDSTGQGGPEESLLGGATVGRPPRPPHGAQMRLLKVP